MLALAEYRASYCECGEPLDESTDNANEYAYTAAGPYRCHACEEIARSSQSYMENHKLVHLPGRWKVERKAVIRG